MVKSWSKMFKNSLSYQMIFKLKCNIVSAQIFCQPFWNFAFLWKVITPVFERKISSSDWLKTGQITSDAIYAHTDSEWINTSYLTECQFRLSFDLNINTSRSKSIIMAVYFDLETTGMNHATRHNGVEPIHIGKYLKSLTYLIITIQWIESRLGT